MYNILLIEDEETLNEVVTMNLQLEGYRIEQVYKGSDALSYRDKLDNFDLVILDVMLPDISGWELCEKFKEKSTTPILFVSAKGTSSDKIKGLKLGADDYLAKPFDLEELLLRVQVLVNRKGAFGKKPTTLLIGNKEVNLSTYEVTQGKNVLATLSKREVDLLELFFEHEGEVLSRDTILDIVWGVDKYPTTRTIDNYILQFRKLFEHDARAPKYFHSIRGVGYKFSLR
ncbi:MAG: response regulator transcription factor [Crocinitomicaceae bacterium]|nr:response regulator transcription factor [Crocinitomicaceae bacterium]